MAADSWLLVMTLFAIGTLFAFVMMVFATKKINGPEYSEWREELAQWKVEHPVWNTLTHIPVFGMWFGVICTLFGPKRPMMKPNSEVETKFTDSGYSPASKILDDAIENDNLEASTCPICNAEVAAEMTQCPVCSFTF